MLNHQEFCKRLRQARKNAGMTTIEAAFVLNTDQSKISRWETTEMKPRFERVVEMAELYGVSLDWLCGLDGGKTDEG